MKYYMTGLNILNIVINQRMRQSNLEELIMLFIRNSNSLTSLTILFVSGLSYDKKDNRFPNKSNKELL